MFREKGAALEIGVRTYMESLFNEYTKPVDFDKNGQFSSTEVDTSDSTSEGEFGIFLSNYNNIHLKREEQVQSQN